MAETNKQTKPSTKISVRLPRNKGREAVQEEFFSVNFKNYIIKRGETVEIPEEVAEVIRNAEMSEEYAMQYVEGITSAEAQKRKDYGI